MNAYSFLSQWFYSEPVKLRNRSGLCMKRDASWFQRNPNRTCRIRQSFPGEIEPVIKECLPNRWIVVRKVFFDRPVETYLLTMREGMTPSDDDLSAGKLLLAARFATAAQRKVA